MLSRIIAVLIALSLPGLAAAQEAEIEQTITQQIDAFLDDDFTMAFTYASPTIRGLFGTPQNFGRMVTQGYPMVWRPADVRFLGLRTEPAGQIMRVQITDQKGGVHILDYQMIETAEGWKINGVALLSSEQLTA